MAEGKTTIEHLAVVMTTALNDGVIQSTTANDENTSSSLSDLDFNFECAAVVIGVVGMVANGFVLYALVASKEHKKHVLISVRICWIFFSSFSLIITYAVQMTDKYLTGWLGYWLCVFVFADFFVWCGIVGSRINLMSISMERYLKVVHPVWSRKRFRNWMFYSAAAFAWIGSLAYNMTSTLLTAVVVDGTCWLHLYGTFGIVHFAVFSTMQLWIFTFCYGRILVAVRCQANVMAGHVASGSSTCQPHMHQIQTNVIMIYVTVFFGVTNFPLDLYFLITSFIPPTAFSGYHVTAIVALVYVSINPFIYATKFGPVKSTLLGLIPCKRMAAPSPAAEAVPGPNQSTKPSSSVSLHQMNAGTAGSRATAE